MVVMKFQLRIEKVFSSPWVPKNVHIHLQNMYLSLLAWPLENRNRQHVFLVCYILLQIIILMIVQKFIDVNPLATYA